MTVAIDVTVEQTGDHWTITRKGAERHFYSRRRADLFVEHLRSLPDEASPLGWPGRTDLLWDRED